MDLNINQISEWKDRTAFWKGMGRYRIFIPIYHNESINVPTGHGSELIGPEFKETYLNIYGMNIIKIMK